MEVFPEKTSFRNFGPRKFFPSPQTRRQVSATASDFHGVFSADCRRVTRRSGSLTALRRRSYRHQLSIIGSRRPLRHL